MLAQEVHLFTTESKEQGLAPAVSKTSEPLMDETVATLREDQYSNPAIRINSSQYDYIVNDIMSCYRCIVRQYIYVRDVTCAQLTKRFPHGLATFIKRFISAQLL